MPFPTTARIIYRNNPLKEVVCQLRFPAILKIDNDPSLFQEAIRKKFPNYDEKSGISRPSEIAISLNNLFDSGFPFTKQNIIKEHVFSSMDENCKVVLSRTFISLSTLKYEKWEDFRPMLKFVFEKFTEIYQPSYFSRAGLRYVDIIDRKKLNLENVDWGDLIQEYMLGIISTQEGKNVSAFDCKYELPLADFESIVTIRTAFAKNKEQDSAENCFLLDSDFFNINKIPVNDIFIKLDFFHDRATRLIRWAIKPKLHQAMNPIEISK